MTGLEEARRDGDWLRQRQRSYLPGVDSPEDDPGPPHCPRCGDESAPDYLPERRMSYWGCCGHMEHIDPYDDPSL